MNDHILSRAKRAFHPGRADLIAIIAAILSILTFTMILPSPLHFPW